MGRLASRSGFTLVEILIVVVILGVLAAIVVPQAANAAGNAAQTAFARNVKQFADVATMHRAREGFWIGDSGSGTLPDGLEDYVDAEAWENGTPIEGVWDSESRPDYDITLGIGVHFQAADEQKDEDYMAVIDAILDDGDLTTGGFQQFSGDRFYYIVEF
ncbi:MAG: type II secretion system protein [Phycisphaerales bacterium]|nr:type II secretion system protein [Phycisphaerales bacterium]